LLFPAQAFIPLENLLLSLFVELFIDTSGDDLGAIDFTVALFGVRRGDWLGSEHLLIFLLTL
jgi:hypothetical protein